MDEQAIVDYIVATFEGVNALQPTDGPGAGDTFFMLGDSQFPFTTIVTKNYGDFDDKSNLDRPGIFRLNIGVSRQTFRSLFPTDTEHDYSVLDTLLPHPVYASQSWVSVLNPSSETFESLKPLIAEAYANAAKRSRA